MINAYIRGYHATNDTPKIFDDFLAHQLLTEEEHKSFDQLLLYYLRSFNAESASSFPDQAAALAWMIQDMAASRITLSRASYTEESLEKAVNEGVHQYVILGAGFDTYAFRHQEIIGKLQIFEVDHPATQAFKRQRIVDLGWAFPPNLTFVPIDFTKDSLAKVLTRSSYDPHAKSFFSWMGVTYYLPREAVFATLRTIADISPTGNAVIFDYLDTDAFIPEKAHPRVQGLLRSVQQEGEPMKAGFNPVTLAEDLAPLGLRLKENLSPSDIEGRFFMGRKDGYHACEHANFAHLVVEK